MTVTHVGVFPFYGRSTGSEIPHIIFPILQIRKAALRDCSPATICCCPETRNNLAQQPASSYYCSDHCLCSHIKIINVFTVPKSKKSKK